MKSFMIVALLAALCSYVYAECNNMCSGHGVCSTSDMCLCYRNYRGADCSERTCQYGRSFVDTAQGDLNHDGMVQFASANREKIFNGGSGQIASGQVDTTNSYNKPEPTKAGETSHHRNHLHVNVRTQWSTSTFESFPASNPTEYVNHVYMECSNKGLCDRTTGECECFDGYEGSACQRSVCPNKCSGHGVCRTIRDMAAALPNQANYTYPLWDGDKIQGCVCDPGYQGYDCSERQCPRGDDPLEGDSTDIVVSIVITDTDGSDDRGHIEFTDQFGDKWKTSTLTLQNDSDDDGVAAALLALPNKAIPSVTVSSAIATNTKTLLITMTGNPGAVYTDFGFVVTGGDIAATITEGTPGSKTKAECSSRGLCDYETGICSCFRGYRGESCSTQSALAF